LTVLGEDKRGWGTCAWAHELSEPSFDLGAPRNPRQVLQKKRLLELRRRKEQIARGWSNANWRSSVVDQARPLEAHHSQLPHWASAARTLEGCLHGGRQAGRREAPAHGGPHTPAQPASGGRVEGERPSQVVCSTPHIRLRGGCLGMQPAQAPPQHRPASMATGHGNGACQWGMATGPALTQR